MTKKLAKYPHQRLTVGSQSKLTRAVYIANQISKCNPPIEAQNIKLN